MTSPMVTSTDQGFALALAEGKSPTQNGGQKSRSGPQLSRPDTGRSRACAAGRLSLRTGNLVNALLPGPGEATVA